MDFHVYALSGSHEWIGSPDELELFFDAVENVQNELPQSLEGVILDIEPYLIESNDQDFIYRKYRQLVKRGAGYSKELHLKYNIVMPFWYDEVPVKEDDLSSDLAQWIIHVADETTIMAYRNSLYGQNGIIELIDEEVNYARSQNKHLSIALETHPSCEGEHISFAGSTKDHVKRTMHSLEDLLSRKRFRLSFAVHDMISWLLLK